MRKGICKHFLGSQDRQCALSVDVRSLVGGPDFGCWLRRPCISVDYHGTPRTGTIPCDKYEDPTDADIAACEAAFAEMERKFTLAQPVAAQIRDKYKGVDWSGVVACPVCGGHLALRHYGMNGHIHGKCATKDCLSWME